MIKAVLFDLDGTLVNSLEDLADSTNFALSKLSFPMHETGAYKYFVGDGIPKLIERALPENSRDSDTKNKCLDIFMARYSEHFADKTYIYDGIKELLSALSNAGVMTAVISNKSQVMVEKVIFKLFGDDFDYVAGKRREYPAKPDPTLTLKVIAELGVKPHECILAGDSGMDMAAAVNSGAFPVGVLWGFRKKEELVDNKAAYLATKPSDIFDIYKEINND